ncbi:MAG TPA: ABC transporter permease [Candidatus Korarchaeota archaeon]|nr:ABC transporter permease [Candidatus Korarchaeota archaeon]
MGMREYILKRVASALVTFALIIVLNFFIFRIMPGDPARAVVGDVRMRPEMREILIRKFGLDKPLWVQFLYYLKNLAKGDLGYSFQYPGTPVTEIILGRRLMNTFLLMGGSIAISLLIGMGLGVVAAWKRGSKLDVAVLTFSLVTYSIPTFWMGLLIILFLGFYADLIPLGGTVTPGAEYANWFQYAADYFHHMIGPLITLVLSFIGYYFMIMRNTLLDVFTEDYMLTARAKGLKTRTVLFRHAMRNAMLPMISVIALEVVYLFSGATATETVFSWHGLGLLIYESVLRADLPVLQGLFLFIALSVLVANLLADITYALVDPRIRYG